MYWQYKHKDNQVSDSIGLLISILVRYPEVGTINYHPENQVLKFTFIFSNRIEEKEFSDFKQVLTDSVETYNMLECKSPTNIDLQCQFCENFTLMEICRDVNTLSKEEISLIIELVHNCFKYEPVTERNDYVLEEDLIMQDELIEHMLENLKASNPEKNLIAFREDGKVLVFNK